MPSRIIREGILDSEAINALSDEAEIFYRRLMSIVDDAGRFEDKPEVIRARCFPLKLEAWPVSRVEKCLSDVSKVRTNDGQMLALVSRYVVDGKRYLQINNFGQRVRTTKYPAPPNDGHLTVICRPNSESESEFNSKAESESEFGGGRSSDRREGRPVEIAFLEGLPDDAFEQILEAYPRKQASARADFRNIVASFESNSVAAQSWFASVLRAARICAKFPATEFGYLPNLSQFISKRWQDDWKSELEHALAKAKRSAPVEEIRTGPMSPEEEIARMRRINAKARLTL